MYINNIYIYNISQIYIYIYIHIYYIYIRICPIIFEEIVESVD